MFEHAPYRRGRGERARFAHAANGHTQVFGLDHDERTRRVEPLHQLVGDLHREPFLHLQPLGEAVDEAGELGQPTDPARLSGYVHDVRLADEGQQVMLADRREGDVSHHHHFVVVDLELPLEMCTGILAVPGEELAKRAGDPRRGLGQSVALGIFADGDEELTDGSLGSLGVEGMWFVGHRRSSDSAVRVPAPITEWPAPAVSA